MSVSKEFIEKLKKELDEFVIGETSLAEIFEPVFDACAKVAKNEEEFKQCVTEAISTLKSVIKKVK